MKSKLIIVAFSFVAIVMFISLNMKPKLPASMVVLRWDFDKIVLWMDEYNTLNGFLKSRGDGMTLLHDIARYRNFFEEDETDYEKFQKLISYYYIQQENPISKNAKGETPYEIALRYDSRIANMIEDVRRE